MPRSWALLDSVIKAYPVTSLPQPNTGSEKNIIVDKITSIDIEHPCIGDGPCQLAY